MTGEKCNWLRRSLCVCVDVCVCVACGTGLDFTPFFVSLSRSFSPSLCLSFLSPAVYLCVFLFSPLPPLPPSTPSLPPSLPPQNHRCSSLYPTKRGRNLSCESELSDNGRPSPPGAPGINYSRGADLCDVVPGEGDAPGSGAHCVRHASRPLHQKASVTLRRSTSCVASPCKSVSWSQREDACFRPDASRNVCKTLPGSYWAGHTFTRSCSIPCCASVGQCYTGRTRRVLCLWTLKSMSA